MPNADLLIKNGYLITMDDHIPDQVGDIVIHQGKILSVGNNAGQNIQAKKTIDATGKLVLPGFINTHTHAAMTLFRGMADDLPLMTWLNDHIWPAEASYMNANTVKLGTELAIIEMIESGTTTFNDMYFFADEVANVAQKAGVRAVISEAIIDFPTPKHQSPELALNDTKELIQKWKDHPLITVAVSCHAPYSCSSNILKAAQELARNENTLFHIHVAETQTEVDQIQKDHQNSPLGYLNDLGLLGRNMVAAHAIHLSEQDRHLLKQYQVGVSHNPESNMKLASGTAPIPDLLNDDISIGLATDGAASNNNLNMIDEMKSAAFLHKLIQNDPTVITAKQALQMATIGGAKVLGMDDKLGSITANKLADIIIVDPNSAHMQPLHHPISQIVYSMEANDIKTVIINGDIVMENRKLQTMNSQTVLTTAKDWMNRHFKMLE